MNIPEVGGWEGRGETQTKCSCSVRISILYAWIELFNFFSFAHFSCIKIALSKSHEFLVLGIPAASIVWD